MRPMMKLLTQQQSKQVIDLPVKHDLQIWYDGYNNTGDGHSATATQWYDLSGNGNHGTFPHTTIGNGFVWKEDAIELISNTSLMHTATLYRLPVGSWTMQMVLKRTELTNASTTNTTLYTQVASDPSVTGMLVTSIRDKNKTLRSQIGIGSTSLVLDGNITFEVGDTIALTIKYVSSNKLQMLFNNVYIGTNTSWRSTAQNYPLVLGGSSNVTTSGAAYKGEIKSIRIYKVELTGTELAELHAYDKERFGV